MRVQAGKGPLSHQVIELAATGQLGMAAAGQIRLAVVRRRHIRYVVDTTWLPASECMSAAVFPVSVGYAS